MTHPAIPSQCSVALKEWATVLQALAHGEQLVLIRKGGLIEPGSGFELRLTTFVFYPTFEHQAVRYLRRPFQGVFEAALSQRAPEGFVDVELAAQVVSSRQSLDPTLIKRLAPLHIYNDEFLNQRLKWQPEQPLVIVLVRAFRLGTPCRLPLLPQYAGCRSWVELASPVPLDGARPVLEDAVFQRRADEFMALLSEMPPSDSPSSRGVGELGHRHRA